MTKATWVLLVLLLGTNAAWVALWLGDAGGTPGATSEESAEREATIDALQRQVRTLRRAERADAGPELVGAPGLAPEQDEVAPRLAAEPSAAAEVLSTAEVAAQAAGRQAQEEALTLARAILEKVMQVRDPRLRAEGLRELAEALQGGDPLLTEYALGALYALRTSEIDRTGFRGTVLGLLDSEHPGVRRSALYALHVTGVEPGDLRYALAAATDEDSVVRRHAARILKDFGDGAFTGETADVVAQLLADERLEVRQGSVHAVANATVTPEIETALLACVARPEERQEAVANGLSQIQNKSRRVVDALFDCLGDENHAIRQRAHWGLQRGLSDAVKPYVARRYVDQLEAFLSPQAHGEALKVIAQYGDASLAAPIERFAENPMVGERVRAWARKVAEHLRTKP